MTIRPLKSRSVQLEHLGPVGNNLCWVEAAHVLSRYYDLRDTERFCRFVKRAQGRLIGCCRAGGVSKFCDQGGSPEKALRFKDIEMASAAPNWSRIFRVLKEESPRLLPLVAGHPSSLVRHVLLINGYIDEEGVEGVETLDPIGGDYRRVYLRSFFEERVKAEDFFPLETSPPLIRQPPPLSWKDTEWNSEVLEAYKLAGVELPPPPAGSISALRSIFVLNEDHRFPLAAFPLKVEFFQQAEGLKRRDSSPAGVRFLLQGVDSDHIVMVDCFPVPGHDKWQLGRLSSGSLARERIGKLQNHLSKERFAKGKLSFCDWIDIGLDVALMEPSTGSQDADRTEIALMGHRSFLNLDQLPLDSHRLASEFIEKLRIELQRGA